LESIRPEIEYRRRSLPVLVYSLINDEGTLAGQSEQNTIAI